MSIFNKSMALTSYLSKAKTENKTIGFVPTMGALHQGHLSLIERSVSENTITVVSIFVNPTQFNNPEDLEKYPRTIDEDVKKINSLSTDIVIFTPTTEEIYGTNIISNAFDFDNLENQMEGKFRQGHFDGVGTIVKKLFEIVTPTNAYFGEKDFQQLQIIRKLVEKHHLDIQITGCPIYREKNGLAMSSRNERLSKKAREKSSIIYEILKQAKMDFKKDSAQKVTKNITNKFLKIPDFSLEYFEIAEEATLVNCTRKNSKKKYRAFIAVFIENIRLIDNISLQ